MAKGIFNLKNSITLPGIPAIPDVELFYSSANIAAEGSKELETRDDTARIVLTPMEEEIVVGILGDVDIGLTALEIGKSEAETISLELELVSRIATWIQSRKNFNKKGGEC